MTNTLKGIIVKNTIKRTISAIQNTVFELHYDTIFDFKKICPHLCVIYLFPKDIQMAKESR